MSRKNTKPFESPKEVFETYFPAHTGSKEQVQADGYGSATPDLTRKLAEEFEASLRSKAQR